MTAVVDDGGDDPFRAATEQLSNEQACALIERIVALFARVSLYLVLSSRAEC